MIDNLENQIHYVETHPDNQNKVMVINKVFSSLDGCILRKRMILNISRYNKKLISDLTL